MSEPKDAVFFSQKALRVVPGNWTFVIITDRIDLDDQIYKNFARCGAVMNSACARRAGSTSSNCCVRTTATCSP